MGNQIDVEDTVQIGDVLVDKDSVTPSMYFEYVKGLKQKINNEYYDMVIDTALALLKKTKVTGQTEMAKELTHQVELALKELDAAKDGFDIFVNRKDIERYIDKVESKCIKIIELNKYEREIPDEVIDRIELAKKHFDQIYIIFTDYTKKETKKVAKERRDKDPIMFGAFHDDTDDDSSNIYIEDRMFFIADWKDDKCELTLEEIVRDVKDKEGKDITYRISNPTDKDAVINMLNSYKTPVEKSEILKPVSIFEKIKKKVTGSRKSDETTKTTRKLRKKKNEE